MLEKQLYEKNVAMLSLSNAIDIPKTELQERPRDTWLTSEAEMPGWLETVSMGVNTTDPLLADLGHVTQARPSLSAASTSSTVETSVLVSDMTESSLVLDDLVRADL